MTSESDFQAKLDACPEDWQTRLVFADWLEEQEATRVLCPTCNGTRRIGFSRKCNFCGGDGVSGDHHAMRRCVYCDGAGTIVTKCKTCAATGVVLDTSNRGRAEGYRALGALRLSPYYDNYKGTHAWTVRGNLAPSLQVNGTTATENYPVGERHGLSEAWFKLTAPQRKTWANFATRREAEDAASFAFSKLPKAQRAKLLAASLGEVA